MSLKFSSIILAGGLGTRLRPLTYTVPKPLIKVGGIPLISHISNSLNSLQEINEILITVDYLKEKFEEEKFPEKVRIINSSDYTNMYSAFINALKLSNSDNIIGISSDIFLRTETFKNCVSYYTEKKAPVYVFLKQQNIIGHKKWLWQIKDGVLTYIKISENKNVFEKYMIIAERNVFTKLTDDFKRKNGLDESDFKGYEAYNKGWIYTLKQLIDNDIKVRAVFLNDDLYNVNTIEDLKLLDNLLIKEK